MVIIRPASIDADDPDWDDHQRALEAKVRRRSGNTLSLFVTTVEGLERAVMAGEAIVAEWRRDEVLLAGEPLVRILGPRVEDPDRPQPLWATAQQLPNARDRPDSASRPPS